MSLLVLLLCKFASLLLCDLASLLLCEIASLLLCELASLLLCELASLLLCELVLLCKSANFASLRARIFCVFSALLTTCYCCVIFLALIVYLRLL